MDDATAGAGGGPWFKDGLAFECTRCGHCCTGEPGYVWVTDDEVAAIARFRKEPVDEVTGLYTRRLRGRRSLRERPNGDCIFWDGKKGCTIYPVRPPQCRTWPFWESNLDTQEDWDRTTRVCPGSGRGDVIPVEEILRRVAVIKI